MVVPHMTVGHLKRALGAWPEATPILLAHDAEGNGFASLYEVVEGQSDRQRVLVLYPTGEDVELEGGT